MLKVARTEAMVNQTCGTDRHELCFQTNCEPHTVELAMCRPGHRLIPDKRSEL